MISRKGLGRGSEPFLIGGPGATKMAAPRRLWLQATGYLCRIKWLGLVKNGREGDRPAAGFGHLDLVLAAALLGPTTGEEVAGNRPVCSRMATSRDIERGLAELRSYRELRRRRDRTIRMLVASGAHPAQIAAAAGISVSQVRRIARTED